MTGNEEIIPGRNLESDRPLYTLAVASRLSGIPTHSIRQYVDKGLLIPFKLQSKRHLFSPNDIARLKHIHFLIREKGLNFAGIRALMAALPCWALKQCTAEDQHACSAFSEDGYPCWEASEKGRICRNDNCRTCEVYRTLSMGVELKSVFKELLA
jgi:MerR family transcriptional regulator/heat shock protein HspR